MTQSTQRTGSDKFEGLIRPDELRKITEEKEMAELRQVLEHQKKVEAEQKDVYQAFLNQHIHPEAKARITAAVRRAAERGEKEIQVLRFSSDFCTDRGRAINNFQSDWPETLTGFAKEAYEAWDREFASPRLQAEGSDPELPRRHARRCRHFPALVTVTPAAASSHGSRRSPKRTPRNEPDRSRIAGPPS